MVWLDGAFVDPVHAALSIDDPGVQFGEGLRETMRGHDGRIPLLDRHLARLERSVAALALDPMPPLAAVQDAAEAVAAALGSGPARIRITVTPYPTLLVDGAPVGVDPDATLTAASIRGTWQPGRRVAEHKTLSCLAWRDAHRRATALGADTALLLDDQGRLGEAATANVFCVIGGEIVTAPIDGILPGVTRDVVMEIAAVREAILDEATWRAAGEMFATSAVRGVVPIVRCDREPVGDGGVGPVCSELRDAIAVRLAGG